MVDIKGMDITIDIISLRENFQRRPNRFYWLTFVKHASYWLLFQCFYLSSNKYLMFPALKIRR